MKKGFVTSMIIGVITTIIAIWFIITTQGNIPTNWNMEGEAIGSGSPLIMIIFPITSILVTLLLYFIPRLDPKGENIKKSGPILPMTMILIAALMLGIEIFIVMAINNGSNILNMITFMYLIIGILFIVLGYYMPRVRHNYMLGIRTPWTLYSEDVWNKTHKASKNWFMGIGLSFLVCMFVKEPYNLIIPLVVTGAVVIGIVIYSYMLFAEEKRGNR